jgi:hypothetical protein
MFERGRAGPFKHGDECPMGGSRRAALAGIQEGGQALGLDLQEVDYLNGVIAVIFELWLTGSL